MNKLTVSSRDLAEYIETLPVLVWASGPDRSCVYFNRAWRDFTGRTLEELKGDAWMADVHPEDLSVLSSSNEAFRDRRPFQTMFRLRRHDGVWRWMLNSASPQFTEAAGFRGFIGACTDATEQKMTEATLRASEARLQLAQKAAGLGTYDWDLTTDKITWSPEMFDLYRIDRSTPASKIYPSWLERLHPDDRDEADAETQRFVEGADQLVIKFRIVLPDGDVRWIEGRGGMIRDEAGRPIRMIGVNFDVTEQRRGELALAESEQRFRSIAENFPGVIFRRVTYDDGRIEYPYFSGPDEAVFHIPRERFHAISTLEDAAKLIHYDDIEGLLERYREAVKTLSTLELEGRVLGPEDEVRWVRSISRPHRRGDGAVVWDGVLIDVTEQHVRESARERAATKLRMGMEVAGIGTWELDPEGKLLTGSAVVNSLFGLGPDAGPLPLETYLGRIHPEDVEQVRSNFAAALQERTDVFNEYRVPQPDGTMRWVASRGAMMRLADGAERMIGALSDVTERRTREEEREAALTRQKVLLREINHRIKNNLQMISSLLRIQASRVGDPEAAQLFSRSIDRVEAISDLHLQLGMAGDVETIDFGDYLRALCAKMRRSLFDESRIDLCCDAEACPLPLDKAVPLGLIANELVTNALKHAFPDGSTGTISVALTRQADGSIRLSVADTGIGIADDVRGDGVGMSLVNGLARQIGGHVQARSERGAMFNLVLPCK